MTNEEIVNEIDSLQFQINAIRTEMGDKLDRIKELEKQLAPIKCIGKFYKKDFMYFYCSDSSYGELVITAVNTGGEITTEYESLDFFDASYEKCSKKEFLKAIDDCVEFVKNSIG